MWNQTVGCLFALSVGLSLALVSSGCGQAQKPTTNSSAKATPHVDPQPPTPETGPLLPNEILQDERQLSVFAGTNVRISGQLKELGKEVRSQWYMYLLSADSGKARIVVKARTRILERHLGKEVTLYGYLGYAGREENLKHFLQDAVVIEQQ